MKNSYKGNPKQLRMALFHKKSVPNGTLPIKVNSLYCFQSSFLFLDPCTLTAAFTLVIQFSPANTA